MRSKISVCIATFNGEKYLEEQLNSILPQLHEEDEIIISDDSSSDGTVTILKKYQKNDSRIKLSLNQKFRDPIQNFQNALKLSTGDIIYLSDQDDVWFNHKVEVVNQLLLEFDLVLHDSIVTDQNLKEIFPSFFNYFGSKKGIIKNIIKSSYYGSCMAFRRSVLVRALPFPKTKEIGQDLWLGLVAEFTGKVKILNQPLIYYRRHEDTFTSRGRGESKRSIFAIVKGRIIMVKEVINFLLKPNK